MGRVRTSIVRHRVPRTRLPFHRQVLADPSVARRWLVVATLAILTGMLTSQVVARAESTRRAWGPTRAVLVVQRTIGPGEKLSGSVRIERWPSALVPEGALTRLPGDAAAAVATGPGTPVTGTLLADAANPDGRRLLAVPAGAPALPLDEGDRVEVWATVDPSLTGGTVSTRRVATDAVVRVARGSSVVLAVDRADVAAVAEAAALATTTLVRTDG